MTLILCGILAFVNGPRRIKPDPNDPEWKFPYATREYIVNLAQYMSEFGKRPTNWHMQQKIGQRTHVLSENRKNMIPFESVPPYLRFRAEQWFNRKIAECKAEGRPNWPSPGKIRSLRMNACNAGRHMWNGEYYLRYSNYQSKKKMWLRWLDWKAQQERREAQEPMPHRVLEGA